MRLRRNFGKSAALAAGFAHAEGEIVVTIDGDLQDDPAEIPRLLAKLDEGFDLVSGLEGAVAATRCAGGSCPASSTRSPAASPACGCTT